MSERCRPCIEPPTGPKEELVAATGTPGGPLAMPFPDFRSFSRGDSECSPTLLPLEHAWPSTSDLDMLSASAMCRIQAMIASLTRDEDQQLLPTNTSSSSSSRGGGGHGAGESSNNDIGAVPSSSVISAFVISAFGANATEHEVIFRDPQSDIQ